MYEHHAILFQRKHPADAPKARAADAWRYVIKNTILMKMGIGITDTNGYFQGCMDTSIGLLTTIFLTLFILVLLRCVASSCKIKDKAI